MSYYMQTLHRMPCVSANTTFHTTCKHAYHATYNTMACIVTRTSKWSHITPALTSLHWLLVTQRVIFKTVTLIYKYLHSGLPKYFGKYITPYESSANTCRADKSKKYLEAPFFNCCVHKSKTNFDCCFSTDGPRLWNGLPEDVRFADSLTSFRNKLKAHLFREAYPP